MVNGDKKSEDFYEIFKTFFGVGVWNILPASNTKDLEFFFFSIIPNIKMSEAKPKVCGFVLLVRW